MILYHMQLWDSFWQGPRASKQSRLTSRITKYYYKTAECSRYKHKQSQVVAGMKFCLSGSKNSMHYRATAGCQVNVLTWMHCHTWKPYFWLKKNYPAPHILRFTCTMLVGSLHKQELNWLNCSCIQHTKSQFTRGIRCFIWEEIPAKSLTKLHHSGL